MFLLPQTTRPIEHPLPEFQPRSAIFKLALAISAAIIGSTLIAMVAIYVTTERHLDNRLKAIVEADLKGLSDLYATRRIIAVRQALERRAKATGNFESIYLLQDKQGKKLAGNIENWPEELKQDNVWRIFLFNPVSGQSGRYLGAGTKLPGGFPILVARSTEPRDMLLLRLRWTMAAALAAIAAIGIALGFWLSRRILGRIKAINIVCDDVERGDLSARVFDTASDEFGILADHVNGMLVRISALVYGSREISDRIAHELRTPLNRILLRIENIRENNPEPIIADELDNVSNDLRDTINIFEALLDIATTEAEAGDMSALKPVSLSTIANEMAELYSAVAEEKEIDLTTQVDEAVLMLGDHNLLNRALANILDNAIKFTPQNGSIAIALKAGDEHVLTIQDSGPGLDIGKEARAFDRFYRGENTKDIAGHGLGLAIVRAIAVRHGIRISLANNNQGLEVTLKCPAYQPNNQPEKPSQK